MFAQRIFLFVSAIVFIVNVLFVAVNYHSAREAFNDEVSRIGESVFASFDQYLSSTYTSMLQLASFVSHDTEVLGHFKAGRRAFLAGDKEIAQIHRTNLFNSLEDSWGAMQSKYLTRQLHFHIGPGDYSFLRLHKPEKFGDDLSSIRHTIVDTIKSKNEIFGFESGRVYSGLRGVVPIFDEDRVVIGALEAGTSFQNIIQDMRDHLKVDISVLLDTSYMKETMWSNRLNLFFAKNPPINGYYIEATSDYLIETILMLGIPKFQESYYTRYTKVIGGKTYAVFAKPLQSYYTQKHLDLNGVGLVVAWKDVSGLVHRFEMSLIKNLLYALLAFVVLEIFIYRGIRLIIMRANKLNDTLKNEICVKEQRLEQFYKTLSYDFNLSMSIIIGHARILLNFLANRNDIDMKEDLNNHAKIIYEHSKLWRLDVDDLLMFDSNGVKFIEDVTVKELVTRTRQYMEYILEQHKVTILEENTDVTIGVNVPLFTYVFTMLISYLINQHEREEVSKFITISAESLEDGISISIQDGQLVLEEDVLKSSFEQHLTVNSSNHNYGVGLINVKHVVEQHLGYISARSKGFDGTRFLIKISKNIPMA